MTATEPLILSTLASSSSQFKLGAPSAPLPANTQHRRNIEVPITFSPTGPGPAGATLTATTSTSKTATFGLSGVGQTAAAHLEVSPPVVTFEGTSVGETGYAAATFRNVGGSPLTIEKVNLPLPSGPFKVEPAEVPAVGHEIESGQSLTITVAFSPTTPGSFNGEIGLETTGGDETVALSGAAGLAGALQVQPEQVEYGQVPLGSSESRSFTVTNTGGTAVQITKSKPPIGGAFAASTTLEETTTIKPGETKTETVGFTPTELGPASAVWPINGKDATGLHEVRFTGEGVLPQAPSVETPGTSATNVTATLITPVGGVSSFSVSKPVALSLTKLQVRVRASSAGEHVRKLLVSYTLSAAATVELTVYRRTISHRCSRGARTCEHWTATKVRLKASGLPGANDLDLNLGGLPAGDYRLAATPIPRSGAAGATAYLRFAVP